MSFLSMLGVAEGSNTESLHQVHLKWVYFRVHPPERVWLKGGTKAEQHLGNDDNNPEREEPSFHDISRKFQDL